jgi:TRAP transporter TAXI family solute receptor
MMRSLKIISVGALILAFLFTIVGQFTVSQGIAAELKGPVKLTLATQPLGGSWYVYGSSIAQMLRTVFPKDSVIDVIPQSGGLGNSLLISGGKADFGLSNAVSNKWAFEGIYFYKEKKAPNIRGLIGGLDVVYGVVILREDFIKKTGLDTIEKIVSKKYPVRVVSKPPGSISPIFADILFSGYGITPADIKAWGGSVSLISPQAINTAFQDGQADLLIDMIPAGQPAVTELAMTTNLRFLPITDKERTKLNEAGFESTVMPSNSFKNQQNDVLCVTPGVTIIARENLPEEVAYVITKTVCDGKPELIKLFPSLKHFDPAQAWKPEKIGMPLHPGAIRYYKEKGWMK